MHTQVDAQSGRPTLAKGGNVISARWQVTLCDPMWHVSSRSGVATLRIAVQLLLTYLLTYWPNITVYSPDTITWMKAS